MIVRRLLAALLPAVLLTVSAEAPANSTDEMPYFGDGTADIEALSLSQAAETGEPVFRSVYAADPSARVINGVLWIYCSHDGARDQMGKKPGHAEGDLDHGVSQDQFDIQEFVIFSATSPDAALEQHGVALHVRDVPWASHMLWAPDVIPAADGSVRLYFPGLDHEGNFRLGVAKADHPAGPFVADPNPIEGSFSIDPNAFTLTNGTTLLYFGGLWAGQLEKWRAPNHEPFTQGQAIGVMAARLTPELNAFEDEVQEVLVTDAEGKALQAEDTDRRFFEGSWVFERGGSYYLMYSTGDTHRLVYARSDNPMGPFQYSGVLLEAVVGWTTHGALFEFSNEWWLLYQDASLSGGDDSRRCVKVGKVTFNEDGTMALTRGSFIGASSITRAQVAAKTRQASFMREMARARASLAALMPSGQEGPGHPII